MLAFAVLLLTAVSPTASVVVEVRVQGEVPSQALGQELAKSIGAISPVDAGTKVEKDLPASAAGRAEAMMEADRLVESGRDLYVDGRLPEAAKELSRARELLSHAVESFDEERKAAEALFRASM